ncbi:protein of unknown function [Methylorubrum extorquens]|uniref:Uncharacterized protein n=1 Tax=Methylorubrum extorquens TaxID=408 RepID=A0A2N9AW71_METEX|nr:protein of unknown function [Methylorubrum extorquens]
MRHEPVCVIGGAASGGVRCPARSADLRAEDILQGREQPGDPGVLQSVVQGLALAPKRDQPVLTQLGEVLRQGRLAEIDRLAEARHVHLTAGEQQAQDEQALLVGEEPQQACGVSCLVLEAQQISRRNGIHGLAVHNVRSTLFRCF